MHTKKPRDIQILQKNVYLCVMEKKQTYSLFCDESCHLQYDGSDVMCIGALVLADSEISKYKTEIKRIKLKYGILHELKWNTISNTHKAMYDELIDLFFNSNMAFRCILLKNKTNIKAEDLDRASYNEYYYSLIEKLIRYAVRHNNNANGNYRIFLDLKDTHSHIKLSTIKAELENSLSGNEHIISMQNIRSHESQFIQMTDLLLGAVSYRARGLNTSKAKIYIVDKIEKLSGYVLNEGTEPGDDKFSIYDFQPKRRNG